MRRKAVDQPVRTAFTDRFACRVDGDHTTSRAEMADIFAYLGVHMAQWAKRPPLKLEVPGSRPRGWFNGRAGNRDPLRWLETARGLSPIRLIGRAQCFPGGLAVPR